MINFNVGAQRPATDDARTARIRFANDLVQKTLSQHGLLPGTDSGQGSAVIPALPDLQSLLGRFQSPLGNISPQPIAIPDGAQFRHEQFSCTAGSRAYRTYVPSTARDGVTGIVVMLHGCTQNPEDFAAGTGMNQLAEAQRFIVIYPHQSRGSNAQSCWNWFSPGDQARDRGEPAILAGMTRKAMTEFGVASDRTFVAGLSAGAAMAIILGQAYPDIFSAVGAHSGLPFGAAKDVPSAFAAMAGTLHESARAPAGMTRTIVFHGTADATVHPSNGERIARDVMDHGARQTIDTVEQGSTSGRSFTRKVTMPADGPPQLEHWIVDGLGHSWSGGKPAGSFTDAKGPDASAEMIRFFFNETAGGR